MTKLDMTKLDVTKLDVTMRDACLATIAALALLAAGPAPALAAPALAAPTFAAPTSAAPTSAAPTSAAPAPTAAPLLPHVSSGDPAPAPAVAGLLSAVAPLGVAGAAGLVYQAGSRGDAPMMMLALAPLALGAGQAYAGDPWRGLAVGAGSYLAGTAGVVGGLSFISRRPASMAFDDALDVGLLGAGAVVLGYYVWSIADAAGTAARVRQAHEARLAEQAARIGEHAARIGE